MKCRDLIAAACLWMVAFLPLGALHAQENLTLSAPEPLWDNGFLKHLLPRFSLKSGVRFDRVDQNGAVAFTKGGDGFRALELDGVLYRLSVADPNEPRGQKFLAWLQSDIGKRTLLAFNKEGRPVVAIPGKPVVAKVEIAPSGDALKGERLALIHCGRCHVVSDKNRMGGIGSTPSFAAMRNLDGWRGRFEAFFTLNPHPSFTQIPDVTEPFDPMRPPMIAPIELSLDDVAAIAAYAASVEVMDLGSSNISK